MQRLLINARFRGRPVTGVERFAMEVSARLAMSERIEVAEIAPRQPLGGLKGHLWEQFALPRHCNRSETLFSPCNTGPVTVENQLAVVHDAAVWDCPEGFSTTFRQVYQLLLPRLANRARLVATVSEFSRQRLARHLGIAEEKIIVLGNAVNPAFSPGECGDRSLEAPSFLCVGSMDPRKNVDRLIGSWLNLKSRGELPEGARLKFIGGTNHRNFAATTRRDDMSIQWLGRVDDGELIRQYRKASAFIYPSTYEGFGLPPLEAIACGCPVLLSKEASLPEVGGPGFEATNPDSKGAPIYFDPFSEEAIGRAIQTFLALGKNELEAMRARSLARSAQFTWEAVALRAEDAIRSIA